MGDQRTIYFGYGSNIWRDQMSRRCPQSTFIGIGILADWRWIINTRGSGNVVPSQEDVVYGSLYELSQSDEEELDKYEDVPNHYIKKTLPIKLLKPPGLTLDGMSDKGYLDALVYVDVERVVKGTIKTEYIYRMNMAIADGLREGIPLDYIDGYLREWVTPLSN
ncbi:hypothetical protein AMATHDRAFT_141847 [Amanita thiersii Skay4041]|uniref:gamma-glutamylcyclotransferase n=1 Tax=Amanita thiersii Skay4041 TaxID=703135 RepID=A0A2A9NNS1_9AGAR|nr:hypothetical protein AMATHDRAFT_141847 [Amanita thiersii Skay4041]